MNRRVRLWLLVGFGIATAVAVSGWILRATFEVQHGRGAETFISAKGLQVHWVDVLTGAIATLVAILVIVVATVVVAWRKKRDLEVLKKMESRDGTRK
jgi:ABC-type amino acid transport system permease subunit